ncbi:MAG: hypothetical protein H6741_09340 [Alphaproteobacteria bacterium]|nr:hypothetical protein [Alphaproteobacteria bacterium]
MMNTIFAELRDEEQRACARPSEAMEAGAGFSSTPRPSDDFSDLDSVVTPLPIDGFARAAQERKRAVVATKEAPRRRAWAGPRAHLQAPPTTRGRHHPGGPPASTR